jgi:hypothetical protein
MRRERLKRIPHDQQVSLCGVTDKRTRLLTDEVGVRLPPEGLAGAEA